tara:strand:+ start:376 stop:696 length:321 start_codon:yes stop_codon:yes gene_type:complete
MADVVKPDSVDEEVTAAEEVLANRYTASLDDPLHIEYEEVKAEYKEAKRGVKTIAERKKVMTMFQEDLIDLAVEASVQQDWVLYSNITKEISSLQTRLATRRNRGF